ncbi:lipopolysaccharide 1,2-glucosyltransferase RfaJ domain protein [Rickettsia rhipicephali str. Ect]|uniref:Lipopolysaccharide 1,2-glucosyltransferase RfaJ domain protein n=1 Tax=Rickettsia rhipicephali str. Ect TaxID=1359199 RepID=A0A0F3PFF6_RICRH|nr:MULTISPECIES: hypothetical protein [spotted fever group]KJV78631.1 lipopolysaccharide 1,2-glucosyltransferase RfaJ domain protein [Rickettsia rhipicephali str. Ect]
MLAKLIILGHEGKVKEILEIKNDDDFLKYYSGYTADEIPFLNSLLSYLLLDVYIGLA